MKIYLHSDNAEKVPRYPMTVSPAGDTAFVPSNDCLPEWKHPNGEPKQIEVVFKFGSAEVDDRLGAYMVARELAHKSRMLRRVFQLFDRTGKAIDEVFDKEGRPVLLDKEV